AGRTAVVALDRAAGDRPPRTPGTRDAADGLRPREGPHSLHLADRCHERKVARRPDVGSAERHQKVDVRGPRSDSSELYQRRPCALVIQVGEAVWIELARDDRLGEPTDV